jgi:trans-aconitate methyltransferase
MREIVGERFPNCEVIGMDLSPIQPTALPENVRFEVDDLQQEWIHPKESFDFIHARCLAGACTDWEGFLAKCCAYLKPGGRVEVSEIETKLHCDDDSFKEDSVTAKWQVRSSSHFVCRIL